MVCESLSLVTIRTEWSFKERPASADNTAKSKVLVIGERALCKQLEAERTAYQQLERVEFVACDLSRCVSGEESVAQECDALEELVLGQTWDVIVFGPALSGGVVVDRMTEEQERMCMLLLRLLQIIQNKPECCRQALVVLTKGVQIFHTIMQDQKQNLAIDRTSVDVTCITHAPLWGMVKTARLEMPGSMIKYVDVGIAVAKADVGASIIAEIADLSDCDVLVGSGNRCVPRIKHKPKIAPTAQYTAPGGQIALIGGNGALGLLVAGWLASRGAKRLLLVSRSGTVNKSNSDAWQKLKDTPEVEVVVVKCDVSDKAAVRKFVKLYAHDLGGVIHCAGVLDDKGIQSQNQESFRNVMSGKSTAALHLHLALQEFGVPPEALFAVFSSVTSLMGNRGQANYGAANAFLDALVGFRRVKLQQGVSLQWGPWAEVGMAKELRRRMVWEKISNADGLGALDTCLKMSSNPILSITRFDPEQLGATLGRVKSLREFFSETIHQVKRLSPLMAGMHRIPSMELERYEQQLMMAAGAGRPAVDSNSVLTKLIQVAKEGQHVDAGTFLDNTTDLETLGLDSISGIEFVREINQQFGVSLNQSVMFELGSLGELRDRVVEQMPAGPSSARVYRSDSTDLEQFQYSQMAAAAAAAATGPAIDADSVLEKLIQITKEHVDPNTILEGDTDLEALGLDSISQIDFVRDVNSQLMVPLNQSVLFELGTLVRTPVGSNWVRTFRH